MRRLVLFIILTGLWAQKATIAGVVADKSTKEPLIGASVALVGTYKGAYTDENGRFIITEVVPGTYTLRVSYVGYNELQLTGIIVKADQTLQLNLSLTPTGTTLQTVEIVGDKPLVNLESGKSDLKISGDEITQTTAVDVQTMATLMPGVAQTLDGLQIRGGRVYETQYVVDGVNAQDPLAGTGFGVEVSQVAIEELEVITGGVDAEYGDGTSGVVAVRLKEGGERWRFYGRYMKDQLGGAISQWGWNTDIFNLGAGGPLWRDSTGKPRLTFFGSFDLRLTDEYFGVQARQLRSSLIEEAEGRDVIFPSISRLLGGPTKSEFFAPRQDNKWSSTVKLAYRIDPRTRLSLSVQQSLGINQNTRSLQIIGSDQVMVPGFQYAFMLQPDNANTYTHRSNLTILKLNRILSRVWTGELTLSRLFVNLRADANGRPFRDSVIRQIYDPASIVTDPVTVFNPNDSIIYVNPGPGLFNNGGIATLWHDHFAEEYTFKLKLTFQPKSTSHFWIFGLEHREQHYQWIDVSRPWVGAPIRLDDGQVYAANRIGVSNDIWRVKPATGGIFFEDRIRYKGIVASLGARFTYWAPGAFVDVAVEDPRAPIVDAVRQAYKKQTALILGRRFKARLLPRLRVSFPVTDNHVLFFNYAHSTRLPHPRFVYAGLDPVYQDRSFLAFLGNPNLNPEVNVGYEIGLKSNLGRGWALQASAFYNDKFDFIVNRIITIRDQTGRFTERVFAANLDYARVRGVDIFLQRQLGDWLRLAGSVTYQVATGKSNSALESLLQIRQSGRNDATQEFFLAWDRPWDIKLWSILKSPGAWNSSWLREWTVFISMTWKSGLRYTPVQLAGRDDFSGRPVYERVDGPPNTAIGSPWRWVDMRITRNFLRGRLSVFIEGRNIFSWKNAAIINPVTGRAYEYPDDVPNGWRDPKYPNPLDTGLPPTDPARYLPPRQVFIGMNWSFGALSTKKAESAE
ncbi:MAG: TonB-dependent receptor [Bacteroidia bacterium]|nr:TonB-dependent receptor [Bacteroidia bacterium]MCX7652930.1 TonB-dependent receptor [Bacteroidia bacterium]MDW8416602.1 TonB-dependent receptor [Bacteroidia bacterium]